MKARTQTAHFLQWIAMFVPIFLMMGVAKITNGDWNFLVYVAIAVLGYPFISVPMWKFADNLAHDR